MTLLQQTDPAHWRELALAWRGWAAIAGRWVAEIKECSAALRDIWVGRCAEAATAALGRIVLRLTLFRLGCWAADQALSEFAAALTRAKHADDPMAAQTVDATTAGLLDDLFVSTATPPAVDQPSCTASATEVRRWWERLGPAQRDQALATHPGRLGSLDGIPAAARDRANRLLLDEEGQLAARLAAGDGPRAYLMGVDPAGDGRAVVALGDPDRAGAVLTHVPGMTADLASFDGELARAERVAVRAAEMAPQSATSTIMWLGYDAPDGIVQAASPAQAISGADGLRRFQDGLRATHQGGPARQTVLGHSYGSLVVGEAAARPGLAADSVVFVGSPGVGVDSAAELAVPRDEVWAATSLTDVIQWAAVSPGSFAEDLALSRTGPIGAAIAFLTPEKDLYFGTNPADPAFGARTLAVQPGAGHLGYWDEGRPALDALTRITLGRGDVIPQ
ncbi:alpha/beta hydrolase [Actinoplanes sp. NPDC051494]|uniref:alpha/beta hydrolase n=1 Tax=Actinoplanes sp. NPDC051494 TaxID=3363907 RepID=UPI0037A35AB2